MLLHVHGAAIPSYYVKMCYYGKQSNERKRDKEVETNIKMKQRGIMKDRYIQRKKGRDTDRGSATILYRKITIKAVRCGNFDQALFIIQGEGKTSPEKADNFPRCVKR